MNSNKKSNAIKSGFSSGLAKLLTPFQHFVNLEVLSGILLLSCSAVALILANSSSSESFEHFWNTEIGFTVANFHLHHTLHHWINDGLMAVFFFVIGLEIKREVLVGELSNKGQVVLPVITAVGGAAVPALIYLSINYASHGFEGWGIPMATDIAFVLGIIGMLGKRVPSSIRIFVIAFAIIDDLIAILVIAFFYTSNIDFVSLFIGIGILVIAFIIKKIGFFNSTLFLILGIISWFFFSESGIHPTIAGVIMALTVPASRKINKEDYTKKVSGLISAYERNEGNTVEEKEQQQVIINEIEKTSEDTESLLSKLLVSLHPVSSFIIMPLFALSNAGVPIDSSFFKSLTNPISFAIILALVLGKPLGIFLSVWASVKLKIAAMPKGAHWNHILAMAALGGMGFTLSLFISVLAFKDLELLKFAKIGVLAGSLISVIAGVILFLAFGKNGHLPTPAGPPTEDPTGTIISQ